MSSAAAVALDTAVAGAADLSRYGRRIVRMIWDPEPTNDATLNQPVWCLGCSYVRETTNSHSSQRTTATTPPPDSSAATQSEPSRPPDTPPDSVSSSFSSSLAYEEHGEDGGWPVPFVDDFEARIWMTYRSGFEAIARSTDPKSLAAMSFTMRLKSLGDQAGFTSDSGWGCMIRSGQSLLANALASCQLGRGTLPPVLPPLSPVPCFNAMLEWRRGEAGDFERGLLSLFADDPRAPYSIHNFVRHGAVACGKYPGEWFGPSATARCIRYVDPAGLLLARC